MRPTIERLREVFAYDPDTGILSWKIKPSRRIVLGQPVGGKIRSDGYLHARIDKHVSLSHRIIWAHYYGEWITEIDHINGNRADNRVVNLRACTRSSNLANMFISSRNTSGIKGVGWDKARAKWFAKIACNGRHYNLGRFEAKEEAAAAYAKAAVQHFGEFARHGKDAER